MTTASDFHVLTIDRDDLASLQAAPTQAIVRQAQRDGLSWLTEDSRLLRKLTGDKQEPCQPGELVLFHMGEELCYQGTVRNIGRCSEDLSELIWRDPRYGMVLDIGQLAPISPPLPYQAFKAGTARSPLPSRPSRTSPTQTGSPLQTGNSGGNASTTARGSTNATARMEPPTYRRSWAVNGGQDGSNGNGHTNGGPRGSPSPKPVRRKSMQVPSGAEGLAGGIFAAGGSGHAVEKSLLAAENATAARLAATQELVHAYQRQIEELSSKLELALKDVGALTEELQAKRGRTDEFRDQIRRVVADYKGEIH